ncbi:MAG: hypothetical protein ABI540_10670 [Spartobacteria bacterium]
MYRSGLGDCFLVTFDPGGKEVHMLIDCGSLGAKTTGVKLADVVADIRRTTNDHLHLLIATHEHQDHVCGFRSCRKEFEQIQVDRVWMAWTENPKDPDAREIVKYKDDLGAALAAAALALTRCSNDESAQLGAAIQSILGFSGDPLALGAAGFAKTVDEAMTFVRTGFGQEALYKKPGGAALEEDWLPGFRFYVLGPPTSRLSLRDMGEHESAELYHISDGMRIAASGAAASADERESEMSFDAYRRLPGDHSLARPASENYLNPPDDWRRIDHEWLRAAADLALQLDSMTNNTSLALAIERKSDGKVLLFPADAQQGNWLSWHAPDMKWTVQEGSTVKEKTADQLLAETVFYKVGHHSSHNATAKAKGLELMRREDELIAFIPVDRAVALGRNPKDSWQMPARALYRRLLEKCQGRVVRSDLGWADNAKNAADKATEKEFESLVDDATWKEWKAAQVQASADQRVKISDLYVDFTLA